MTVPLHSSNDNLAEGGMFKGKQKNEGTLFRLEAQLEKGKPWFGKALVI
jgi:Asp-tRNA(Asn)/Glu-tRNA(Gln) amidotransferase A subunit family amidase